MLSPHLKPNLILTFANVRPKGYLLPYIMKPKKRVVLNFNWLVKREGRSQAFQFPTYKLSLSHTKSAMVSSYSDA